MNKNKSGDQPQLILFDESNDDESAIEQVQKLEEAD